LVCGDINGNVPTNIRGGNVVEYEHYSKYCLYYVKYVLFSQLTFSKIIKNVATRCRILRLKCNKFDFGWGSVPDPAEGANSAPPDPIKGSYF